MASPDAAIDSKPSKNASSGSRPAVVRDDDHVTKYLRSETDLAKVADLESLDLSLQALGSDNSNESDPSTSYPPSTPKTHCAESATTPHTGYSDASKHGGVGKNKNVQESFEGNGIKEENDIAGLGAWLSNDSVLDRADGNTDSIELDITEISTIEHKEEAAPRGGRLMVDNGELPANTGDERNVEGTIQNVSGPYESMWSSTSDHDMEDLPSVVHSEEHHDGVTTSPLSIQEPSTLSARNIGDEGSRPGLRRRFTRAINVTRAQHRFIMAHQRSRSGTTDPEESQAQASGPDIHQLGQPAAPVAYLTGDTDGAFLREPDRAHIGDHYRGDFPGSNRDYDLESGLRSSTLLENSFYSRSDPRKKIFWGLFTTLVIAGLGCAVVAAAKHGHPIEARLVLFLEAVLTIVCAINLIRAFGWSSWKAKAFVIAVIIMLFSAAAFWLSRVYPNHKDKRS